MSYKSATEQLVNEKEEVKSFRLATVSALFSDGCPKITFFGEETPSEKKYKVIDDTSYTDGDTVLVGIVNDGYVIMGAVGYSPGSGGATVYLTEAQANLLFATKSHTHTEYAPSSHTHSTYAPSSHTHSEYASSSHKHTTIYASTSSTGTDGVTYDGSALKVNSTSNNPTLGTSSNKWGQIYSTNSAISTSDRKKKKLIESLDERYMKFFRLLKPKRYKFKDGQSNRYHTGIISQDVEKALKEAGLTDSDFAGFIKSPRVDKKEKQLKGYDYGLRYEEFIPINIAVLQNVLDRLDEQDKRIEQLERRLPNEQDISNQP